MEVKSVQAPAQTSQLATRQMPQREAHRSSDMSGEAEVDAGGSAVCGGITMMACVGLDRIPGANVSCLAAAARPSGGSRPAR
jgi:hypothetical protein